MARALISIVLGICFIGCYRDPFVSAFMLTPLGRQVSGDTAPLSLSVMRHVFSRRGSGQTQQWVQCRSFQSGRRKYTKRYAAVGKPLPLSMAGEALILTEENVVAMIAEAKKELVTLFGDRPENAAVGITGNVEYVSLDGPTVIVRLTGRFWHKRTEVLGRVASYVLTRIPECTGFEIEDPAQLEDSDPTFMGTDDHLYA